MTILVAPHRQLRANDLQAFRAEIAVQQAFGVQRQLGFGQRQQCRTIRLQQADILQLQMRHPVIAECHLDAANCQGGIRQRLVQRVVQTLLDFGHSPVRQPDRVADHGIDHAREREDEQQQKQTAANAAADAAFAARAGDRRFGHGQVCGPGCTLRILWSHLRHACFRPLRRTLCHQVLRCLYLPTKATR